MTTTAFFPGAAKFMAYIDLISEQVGGSFVQGEFDSTQLSPPAAVEQDAMAAMTRRARSFRLAR